MVVPAVISLHFSGLAGSSRQRLPGSRCGGHHQPSTAPERGECSSANGQTAQQQAPQVGGGQTNDGGQKERSEPIFPFNLNLFPPGRDRGAPCRVEHRYLALAPEKRVDLSRPQRRSVARRPGNTSIPPREQPERWGHQPSGKWATISSTWPAMDRVKQHMSISISPGGRQAVSQVSQLRTYIEVEETRGEVT